MDFRFRALIVDEATIIRELTVRSLEQMGFQCDTEADGVQAQTRLKSASYDVVLTELRLPGRNGYQLLSGLLEEDVRPVIVVVTDVKEPRLTQHLLARGVDDILYKPVDYCLLGAKVSALVQRRRANWIAPWSAENKSLAQCGRSKHPREDVRGQQLEAIALEEVVEKLTHLSAILPVSQAALHVFNLAHANDSSTRQVAEAIEREASLAVEVLKLANSAHYNRTTRRILNLEEAVVRIGNTRIGELALASAALSALTQRTLPWLDIQLTWQRSVAAARAIELLSPQLKLNGDEQGLFVGALLHDLGRIVLGTLYPREYEALVNICQETGAALVDQERRTLPESHSRVMARLLALWNVPSPIYEPLKYIADSRASSALLDEPLRLKVETIQVAALIGRLAAARWEPWDLVDAPPPSMSKYPQLETLVRTIEQMLIDLEDPGDVRRSSSPGSSPSRTGGEIEPVTRQLKYCNLSPAPFDLLAAVVPSMGIRLLPCEVDELESAENILVNCLEVPPYKLAPYLDRRSDHTKRLTVTDNAKVPDYCRFGRVVGIRGSYAALRTACRHVSAELPPKTTSPPSFQGYCVDPLAGQLNLQQ